MAAPPLAWIVLGALLAERLLEVAINRRHVRWLAAHGARWHGRDGFGLIVASQVALFAFTFVECSMAPWSGPHAWTWLLLAVALGAQALRYWVIRTLGPRWTVRVVTLPSTPPIASGPYRWLRHPNYLAVALEAFVIPLALGAWISAAVVGALALVALASRIRFEDRALRGIA